MKYYVFNIHDKVWPRTNESCYNESAMHRKDLDGDWLICKSNDQLRSYRKYDKDYPKDQAVYTFKCDGLKKLEVFEGWLKDNFNIPSYREVVHNAEEAKANDYANQLYKLHNESEKIVRLTVSKHIGEAQIIYLLKYNGIVVYVGQSNTTARPYQHTDKIWDEVEYLFIPNEYNLNLVEKAYIDKYKPEYNKANPVANDVMLKVYQKLISKIN